jgi:hypothetical protein
MEIPPQNEKPNPRMTGRSGLVRVFGMALMLSVLRQGG